MLLVKNEAFKFQFNYHTLNGYFNLSGYIKHDSMIILYLYSLDIINNYEDVVFNEEYYISKEREFKIKTLQDAINT